MHSPLPEFPALLVLAMTSSPKESRSLKVSNRVSLNDAREKRAPVARCATQCLKWLRPGMDQLGIERLVGFCCEGAPNIARNANQPEPLAAKVIVPQLERRTDAATLLPVLSYGSFSSSTYYSNLLKSIGLAVWSCLKIVLTKI